MGHRVRLTQDKVFSFDVECELEPLVAFEKGGDTIGLRFLKDHSICCLANGALGIRKTERQREQLEGGFSTPCKSGNSSC